MDAQLKKGVLELCVLSIIDHEETYGYYIYQSVNGVLGISESTIYPVLRRLVKKNYLSTYLKPSVHGPARKFFKITEEGKTHLVSLRKGWKSFEKSVNHLIGVNEVEKEIH